VDKQVLRLAMRGVLPESIRLRRKAPLADDPLSAYLRTAGFQAFPHFEPTRALDEFVDPTRIPLLTGEGEIPDNPDDLELQIRPLCLGNWLSRVHLGEHPSCEETCV
jgi:hypothetical protein